MSAFGPQRPFRLPSHGREPMLMDLSTAKAPADFDLEKVLAKLPVSTRGPVSKSVYDTSTYLEKVREEDPWPEDKTAEPLPIRIENCRILDASPVDIVQPVHATCDVICPSDLPDEDRWVEFHLWLIFRDREMDVDCPTQKIVQVPFGPGTIHHPKVQVDLASQVRDEPAKTGESTYIIAEARRTDQKLSVRSPACPVMDAPTTLRRVRLLGHHFDEGKAFPHPTILPALRKVADWHREEPRAPLVVLAHAAKQGDAPLALARAKAIAAILTNQWPSLLGDGLSPGLPFGVREAQVLLIHLGLLQPDHSSGNLDDPTSKALQAFQASLAGRPGAPESHGRLDGATRKALVHAYVGQEGTTLSKGARIECRSGIELTDTDTSDAGLDPEHVEIFLSSPRLEALPKDPLTNSGGWYSRQLAKLRTTETFETHALHFRTVDPQGANRPDVRVALNGPETREARSDEHGWVSFSGLARGTYKVEQWIGTTRIGESDIEVPQPSREDLVRSPEESTATAAHPPLVGAPGQILTPISDTTVPPTLAADGIDVPIFDSHFHDDHHFPNLVNDDFLEALAGLAAVHKAHGKCTLKMHPMVASYQQELTQLRLRVAEAILHKDADAWKDLTKNATPRDLQSFLKYFASKGWHCDPGALDGKMGPKTRLAIQKFQSIYNEVESDYLVVDGQCGPKTWKAILNILSGSLQPRTETA